MLHVLLFSVAYDVISQDREVVLAWGLTKLIHVYVNSNPVT